MWVPIGKKKCDLSENCQMHRASYHFLCISFILIVCYVTCIFVFLQLR